MGPKPVYQENYAEDHLIESESIEGEHAAGPIQKR